MKLTVIESFAAAHSLDNYDGPCAKKHGHTWKVEVVVDSTALMEKNQDPDLGGTPGMSADFGTLKSVLRETLPDHEDLNECFDFNPTAEALAIWLAVELQRDLNKALPEPGVTVLEVKVWESERAAATVTRHEDF